MLIAHLLACCFGALTIEIRSMHAKLKDYLQVALVAVHFGRTKIKQWNKL